MQIILNNNQHLLFTVIHVSFFYPKYSNSLVAVTSAEVKTIPPMVEDRVDVSECTPDFAGMKYCTTLQYTDASSRDAPYFPFNGDSKLVDRASEHIY